MSTRKNTKFNKNNGYKDFTFSRKKLNHYNYNKIASSKNNDISENMLDSTPGVPIEANLFK